MSIIEKAFEKARKSGRVSPNPAPPARYGAARPSPPEVSRSALAAPPFATAGHAVPIDLDETSKLGLTPPEEMASRLREEFRRIKWPLLDVALRRTPSTLERPNLIMVTSSVPSEGKTFSSFNLAMSMAREQDCAVILVDADLAKPKLTRSLGLADSPGLSDYLSKPSLHLSDVVLRTSVERVYVLPSGAPNSSGPELVAGLRMQQLLAELAMLPAGFVVLFDSPPLLATSEAQVLSRLVGQVALVVKADSTPRHAVQEAMALVHKEAALGLILTQNTSSFGAQYFDGYYQYGEVLE